MTLLIYTCLESTPLTQFGQDFALRVSTNATLRFMGRLHLGPRSRDTKATVSQ